MLKLSNKEWSDIALNNGITDTAIDILKSISEGVTLSSSKISDAIGISRQNTHIYLNALMDDDFIVKVGSGPTSAYRLNEKKIAQEYLSIDYLDREVRSYQPDFFDSYQPNSTFLLSKETRDYLRSVSDNALGEGQTINDLVFKNLMIDFSFASSMLEGNQYTLMQTRDLIDLGKKVEGLSDSDAVMIENHYSAISYVVKNIEEIDYISPLVIKGLHKTLSRGLLEKEVYEGNFRKAPVSISMSAYVPISGYVNDFDDISDQITPESEVSKFCEKLNAIEDPFEGSFFALVGISYLQSFQDVNKRTARLVSSIPLLQDDLCPISYLNCDQNDYMKGLMAFYELNSSALLEDFFVQTYELSAKRYKEFYREAGLMVVQDPDKLKANNLVSSLVGMLVQIGDTDNHQMVIALYDRINDDKVKSYVDDLLTSIESNKEDSKMKYGINDEEYHIIRSSIISSLVLKDFSLEGKIIDSDTTGFKIATIHGDIDIPLADHDFKLNEKVSVCCKKGKISAEKVELKKEKTVQTSIEI